MRKTAGREKGTWKYIDVYDEEEGEMGQEWERGNKNKTITFSVVWKCYVKEMNGFCLAI